MLRVLFISIFLLLLISCGGGSHEPREESNLYFIDSSYINGIDYSCGQRHGVSKTIIKNNNRTKNGVITCVYSPLKLKLGMLELGSIKNFKDGQKIYSQDLISSFNGDFNNIELLKMSILLQSLDDKRDKDYINIPKSIKDKIDFRSLTDLTIDELNKKIIDMGITPIAKESAKLNLILNSPSVNRGKPKIELFEEDIGSELTVGSIIGKVSIDRGDGTLILPFLLEGDGKENFLLNADCLLKLIQNIDTPKTYNLKVTATNEFGSTTGSIIIHAKEGGKIAKAQMGRLSKGVVNLFKINNNGKKELISVTETKSKGSFNQIGNFDLKEELLDDQSFYIYEIVGGEDIDIDDNGVRDKNYTNNRGVIRLITKGIWVKNAMYKIRVTPLSQMLYSYVKDCNILELEEMLNKYSKILLDKSLDEDSDIDAKDIMFFNPTDDMDSLYPTLKYNNTYQDIVDEIRAGDNSYKDTLFNAYIIDSFSANAIEIVGSTVYTIDMLNSGNFSIYDLKTKKKIGTLKLPNTPYRKDIHTIYVNLLDGDIVIGSLDDWSYFIDIHKQNSPKLLKSVYFQNLILSGNFSRLAIGKNSNESIFSKNRALYFYDLLSKDRITREIKFFKIDKDSSVCQYKFDSKLSNINSLWSKGKYIYILGDNKIHLFSENNNIVTLEYVYDKREVSGNILGIENNILYILDNKNLILIDITLKDNFKFIEEIRVPFSYKFDVKTNGNYITTGSQIIDIETLRASNLKRSR